MLDSVGKCRASVVFNRERPRPSDNGCSCPICWAFLFVITAKCEGTQVMEFTAIAEIPWY